MKINVVIPSYNCGKYIEETVNSVINQNYDDLRVIIVNDGSKDSTEQVCLDLIEKNGKSDKIVYLHKENGGVSSARNVGIEYVLNNRDGFQYICFLDSDDLWRRDFFTESVIEALEAKTDVIGFEMCRCSNDMKKAAPDSRLLESPNGKPLEQEYSIVDGGAENIRCLDETPMGSIFYSVDLIEKTGIRFFDGLKYSEDKIFRIQCMYAAQQIARVTRVLYLYRNAPLSAMSRARFDAEYYKPIVDAYIKCDMQMLEIKREDREELVWGRTLAALYTTEMADEMYRSFKSESEVNAFFNERQYLIENLKKYGHLAPSAATWLKENENSKKKYILRQKITGIKNFFKRALKRMPIMVYMYNRNTYTRDNKYV